MTANTATKSLSPEAMEKRVARFDTLQSYQTQNFDAHGIPLGAVEKITAQGGTTETIPGPKKPVRNKMKPRPPKSQA